jgi:hypothetical protein
MWQTRVYHWTSRESGRGRSIDSIPLLGPWQCGGDKAFSDEAGVSSRLSMILKESMG